MLVARASEAVGVAPDHLVNWTSQGFESMRSYWTHKCSIVKRAMSDDDSGSRCKLLASCAPVLLTVVALIQMYEAREHDLSPWKGGGFGMFSTVDSPAVRFFRIFLISGTQHVPVSIPDRLRSEARAVRTLPTPSRLNGLAEQIAAGTWVPYDTSTAMERYRTLLARPAVIPNGTDVATATVLPGTADIGAKLLRMQDEQEPKPKQGLAFELKAARVELWKYHFDPQTSQLQAVRVAQAEVVRSPR
jgi:hypothetical protein